MHYSSLPQQELKKRKEKKKSYFFPLLGDGWRERDEGDGGEGGEIYVKNLQYGGLTLDSKYKFIPTIMAARTLLLNITFNTYVNNLKKKWFTQSYCFPVTRKG